MPGVASGDMKVEKTPIFMMRFLAMLNELSGYIAGFARRGQPTGTTTQAGAEARCAPAGR
jgi:hypothetical protein